MILSYLTRSLNESLEAHRPLVLGFASSALASGIVPKTQVILGIVISMTAIATGATLAYKTFFEAKKAKIDMEIAKRQLEKDDHESNNSGDDK